ncbi:MAG: LAGLIDADG family homing endonuclease [Minisyncoccia bacterium]|jgi:hypothetical protein
MKQSAETIERIKLLRQQGFTLGEIITETNIPKSTAFYHIKNLAKSNYLKGRLLAINRAKQKTLTDGRRGKSVKPYSYRVPLEWNAAFVGLVAHFMFDGEISRVSSIYNNRSRTLVNNVISLMDTVLGVSDYKLLRKPDGVLRVSYHHVEIAAFLRQKVRELLSYIRGGSYEEKTAFLKAFYDDEGNVTFTPRKRIVRGYQHSLEILQLVKELLADLGIASRMEARFYELCISRRADLLRFRDVINFSDGVCINGLRSNSVWKESLEKKEILERLINSYRC